MDEFLKDTYICIFKRWVLMNTSHSYHICIDDKDENIILIQTKNILGQVIFNPFDIIELSITDKETHCIEFYLHFQMKTLKHAIALYQEMLESMQLCSDKPQVKILLCCSGGLTTSFFALKMNEAYQVLEMNVEVSAIGYTKLYEVGQDYDVILLAPQISYLHAKVKNIFKDKVVLKIPPQVFAKYDVSKMISLIEEKNKEKKALEKIKIPSLKLDIYHHKQILSVSIYKTNGKVIISYRLFDQRHVPILEQEIIKKKLNIQDIYDVLDTLFLKYPHIDIVGISLSTFLYQGCMAFPIIEGIENNDIYSVLSTKYSQQIFITNDANNAAIGYYATQDQYRSLVYIFQPIGERAGSGIIIDGQLIKGYQNFAGEIKYLPLEFSDDPYQLSKTPEGTIELACQNIISIMCMLAPEVIVIYSDLIVDIEDVKKEVKKRVPEECMPQLIKADMLNEYILLGQMVWCSSKI